MSKILSLVPISGQVDIAIKKAKEQGVKLEEVSVPTSSPVRITAQDLQALGVRIKKSPRQK